MTICYHGEEVNMIVHTSIFQNISTSYSYVNSTSKTQWIQMYSLAPVNGTPIISIMINKIYASQNFTMAVPFTFQATNELEEIELPAGAGIVISIIGGTGSLSFALVVAQGV
ncbi:MAG: hypothetical protein QXW71_00980 [Thermoplasmata archaeon]